MPFPSQLLKEGIILQQYIFCVSTVSTYAKRSTTYRGITFFVAASRWFWREFIRKFVLSDLQLNLAIAQLLQARTFECVG